MASGFHVLTQVSQLQPRQNELGASHRSVQHSLFLEQRRMFGMKTLAQRRPRERVSRRGKKPRCLVSCSVGARRTGSTAHAQTLLSGGLGPREQSPASSHRPRVQDSALLHGLVA